MSGPASAAGGGGVLPRRLLAALAVQGRQPEPAALAEAMRGLVDGVVLPAVGPELQWTTTVVRRGADLGAGAGPEPGNGRDWRAAFAAGDDLEAAYLSGAVPARPTVPPDPRAEPVHGLLRRPGATGPATLAVSVHEWALPAGPAGAGLPQALVGWLLATAASLGAETGYVALDVVDAWDGASSWELAVQAPPARRDVTGTVWGYGWATLLAPAHVEAVGGATALSGVPGSALLHGPDGQVLVRLGDDPAAVRPEQVAALREALRPVLPVGFGSLEEYQALADDPWAVAPAYVL